MPRKFLIAAIITIAVLALTGGTLALNGYFGGGGDINANDTTRGLVGYWAFEEGSGLTAADSSDQGNNGTLTGVPVWTSGKAGNGGALDFDGSSDFVDVGAGPGTVNTVAFWVNPTTTTEYPVDLNGTAYIWINAGTVTAQGFTSPTIYVDGAESSTVSAGSWQYVAVTTGTSLNASDLDIGRVEGTGNHEGRIDEVRIYNRALSAAEIKMLYNHGGPVIHLKMDEGSGSTAYDASGGGNNGLITGATYTTGQFGTALDFDGSGDAVSLSHFDSASESSDGAGDENITWSHTVGTGNDRVLVVGVYIRGLGNSPTVSGITYNGTALTKVDDETNGAVRVEQWYLLSPDSGTHNIVASFSAASEGSRITGAVSLHGLVQAAPEATNSTNTSATSVSVDVTTVTDGAIVVDAVGHRNETDQDITPGANQTERMELAPDTGNLMAMSTEVQPSAGATTMSWSGDVSHSWAIIASAFRSSATFNTIADNFTVSAWVNPSSSIATKALIVKNDEMRLVTDASGNLLCQIHNGSSWQTAATSSVALSLGSWQHVLCTYDQTDLKVYINGMQTASQSLAGISIGNTVNEMELGNDAGGTYADYEGIMDDFRYYDYARTAGEIRLDYNAGFAARFGGSPADWLTQGLVGHWDFEEGTGQTAADSSAEGNDGTLGDDTTVETDDPVWTATGAGLPANAFGVGGSALDFTTADVDEVKVPDSTSLNITGSAITLSLWLNGDNVSTGGRVLSKALYELRLFGTTARLFLGTSTGNTNHDVTFAWANNTWYHFVGVYDGAEMTVFINGTEIGTPTSKTGTISSTAGTVLQIGNGITGPFDGRIDEVRIYNRALTDEEIRYLYNQGKPVAHYKMDEGSGSTAFDSAGANDGTLTSMEEADWVSGQFGTALDFDGVNEYVACTDASCGGLTKLDFDADQDFSFSAWINTSTAGTQTIVSKRQTGGPTLAGYLMRTLTGPDRIQCLYSDGTTNIADVKSATFSYSGTGWHHASCVYKGSSGEAELYINGNLAASGAISSTAGSLDNAFDFRIGALGHASTFVAFDGVIDDVRVYQYARSASEIQVDYNAGLAAKFGGSPNQDVTRGLVGYWDFEEGSGQTAADQTDQSNDGTLGASSAAGSDDPTWTTGKAGNGGALDFNGNGDFVNLGSDSSLQPTTAITVAAWVNITGDNTSGDDQSIVDNRDNTAGNDSGWLLQVEEASAGRDVRFFIYDTAFRGGGTYTLSTGQWYFLTGTWSKSSGDVKVYVDGVLRDTFSGNTSDITYDTHEVSIGQTYSTDGSTTGSNEFVNGLIDEVRVYNRALSAAEIRYLHNKGGPVGHWKFDEGIGTGTVYDSAGSNDGTMNNMTEADWVTGQYGTALDFDGSDDYIDLGETGTFDFTGSMTLSAWVKRTGALPISTDDDAIVAKFGANGNRGWQLVLHGQASGAVLSFNVATNGTTINEQLSSVTPELNQWYHLVGVYDSSAQTMDVYIDGVIDNNSTPTVPSSQFSPSLEPRIGRRSDGLAGFAGVIDDVRIYQYARSAEEILQDYNAGLSTHFR